VNKPKISEKRWSIDLEKNIQENHYEEVGKCYSFDSNSKKESFVIDTPPPYPSGTWHIGAVAQYSMIDVIARSQRLLGKEIEME
jgi:valyl-tRNA synthetase